jgi:phospholipase A2
MIGLTGYLNAMKKTGALDCVTYLSGISGSCWTMSLYYNHLSNNDPSKLQHHFERQLGTHWANMTQFFNVLNTSHHHAKVVLQGAIQRFEQRQGDMSLVDIFGMLMGGTLLTTKKMTEHLERNKNNVPNVLDEQDMYLSHQAEFIKDAKEPLPIYCVVRHEVGDMVKKDQLGDIYQWFEFTPFEMGCEEMEAWIPIWGFGRKFENGKSQERLPEQTLDILMG